MSMPLDQEGEEEQETWVWKIFCSCEVKCEVSVSIRKTSKKIINRLLVKFDDLFYKWNHNNPLIAYEKKVIDLRKIPNLWIKNV
jgi:hypothetical protein